MSNKSADILRHYKSLDDAKYALHLINDLCKNHFKNPDHIYIGLDYASQEYYEIENGEINMIYYGLPCGRFEYPRTPRKLEKVKNEAHLIFFSVNELKEAIESAS